MNVLTNQCEVSEAWEPKNTEDGPRMEAFPAIWDTGATRSVISQSVVDTCGLESIGVETVYHAQGEAHDVPAFLVNVGLPNNVRFPGLRVTLGELGDADVLIGMDIIKAGDFAVTHRGGTTKFSFRIPSQADIDFVVEAKKANIKQSGPSQETRARNRQKRKAKKN